MSDARDLWKAPDGGGAPTHASRHVTVLVFVGGFVILFLLNFAGAPDLVGGLFCGLFFGTREVIKIRARNRELAQKSKPVESVDPAVG